MKVIDFANVSFSFEKDRPILENVSWSQNSGTLRFITGPSGSGKTTLLHLLLGLYRPTEGEIWINDCNLTQLTDRELTAYRQQIGTVFQHDNLIEHRTVFENVATPLWIRGVAKDEVQSRVTSTLEQQDLLLLRDVTPKQLSSGDQQRVAIARALIMKPQILVADEPTGNLDKRLANSVLSSIRNEVKEGRTVILVTHDERLIDPLSDQVSHLVPAPSNSGARTF